MRKPKTLNTQPQDDKQAFFNTENNYVELVDKQGNKIDPSDAENYASLLRVLRDACEQASHGKGRKRHAKTPEPFEKQQIVEIGKRLGGNPAAGPLFQAVKKIYESGVLPPDRAIQELYGAINYIAAAVLIFEEEQKRNR